MSIRLNLTFLLVVVLNLATLYAGNLIPIGSRSAGLNNATVASSDGFSVFQNQAGLASLKNISAGISIENRFFSPELNAGGFYFAAPTKIGVFGISVSRFGYSLYSESKYGLTYSKMLGDRLAMAVQLDYFEIRLGDIYGSKSLITGEVGFIATMTDDLNIGVHLFNPTRTRISQQPIENLNTALRIGLAYSFSSELESFLELEKELSSTLVTKAAIEYNINKKFFFRVGLSNNPNFLSFGFGAKLKSIRLDIAAQYHQVLGITPQISFQFQPSTINK